MPAPVGNKTIAPPEPQREFRGVWMATVLNLDWPSRTGLSAEQQKREIDAALDKAKELNFNAVVYQVRPAGDALYDSKTEPWSEYLSGQQDENPGYDPLAYIIEGAHRRGLELHAWFNPFRVKHKDSQTLLSERHVSRQHPEFVKSYGGYLWLDPGNTQAREYVTNTILDVVKRYDIDGVHLDDYFYPYPVAGEDFPDEENYQSYKKAGGTLPKDDWRRDNVNQFVRDLYASITVQKNWMKFGISPSGIWKSDNPPGVRGSGAYATVFADAKKWFNEGSVDYLAPQLYWRISDKKRPFNKLLKWWALQNTQQRDLYVGTGTYNSAMMDGKRIWPLNEIAKQIDATRASNVARGNIHFRMKVLQADRSLADSIKAKYQVQALTPAMRWKAPAGYDPQKRLPKLNATLKQDGFGNPLVSWPHDLKNSLLSKYLVQVKTGDVWRQSVLPLHQTEYALTDKQASALAIRGVDRYGLLGPVSVIELKTQAKIAA